MRLNHDFVVLISADVEWQALLKYFPSSHISSCPYGNWFYHQYKGMDGLINPVVIMHGGWGKVAAAGSTQFAISRWHPKLIVNLGTCGGFSGEIEVGDIILVNKTWIYDIFELMGDTDAHIRHYQTDIDNSWLSDPYPLKVICTSLISADRDLVCGEISALKTTYGAIAGDWESGAIAWVAAKNQTDCLILRGVTDLVDEGTGEAYNGNISIFYKNTAIIMKRLVESLPEWLLKYLQHNPRETINNQGSQQIK
jgi:adenosylhomocysteine nucleosidase